MNIKKESSLVRNNTIIVKLNEAEKKKIDSFASEIGLTTGCFVRLACNEYIEKRAGK